VKRRDFNLLLLSGFGTSLLAGCDDSSDSTDVGSSAGYQPLRLTQHERENLLLDVRRMAQIKAPYVWGGDTPEGFDCSGLIQWAYRQQGFGYFINRDRLKTEITAHNLYHQNSIPVDSLADLEQGDFIFFDENGDGRITHNSVFDHQDEAGNIWVYDAYSVAGKVMRRVVADFDSKGPLFAYACKAAKV